MNWKIMTIVVLVVCFVTAGFAAAGQEVEAPADCARCGMNRTAFSHSRVLAELADGSTTGTCSINCALAELEGRTVKRLSVADYNSRRLIDARTAVWVIGGSKRGVMTSVPKWAFSDKAAALRFIKESGGTLADYDEVAAAVNAELQQRMHMQHRHHGE